MGLTCANTFSTLVSRVDNLHRFEGASWVSGLLDKMAIGEAGSITTGSPIANQPITVTLTEALDDPVFAFAATSNGGDDITIRLTGQTLDADGNTTSFTFIIEEWEFLDGPHPAIETVNWLAIEEGVHKIKLQERNPQPYRAEQIARCRRDLAQARAALPFAKRYTATCKRISKSVNFEALQTSTTTARDNLQAHVNAIMSATPQTMEGVAIMAEAQEAWAEVPSFYKAFNTEGHKWAAALSQAVLQQAKSGAAV